MTISIKKQATPWKGIPTDFNVSDYEGFVYEIVNTLTLRRYIGRKYFWSKRKTKKVKGKKRKIIKKESDWRYYKSSSDELKADITRYGLSGFTFEVLSLHKTRAQTNYAEVKEMFSRDVLYSLLPDGTYEYFNACILNRYYRQKQQLTED